MNLLFRSFIAYWLQRDCFLTSFLSLKKVLGKKAVYSKNVHSLRRVLFSFILLFIKKALENKAVCTKHVNSPVSVMKAFNRKCSGKWVFRNFCRNSWEARAKNFIFLYCCKLEGCIFTKKITVLNSPVLTNVFSWQLCKTAKSKNTTVFPIEL